MDHLVHQERREIVALLVIVLKDRKGSGVTLVLKVILGTSVSLDLRAIQDRKEVVV